MNQAVDAAVQADEDTEVSDRLDFTFNTVALVVGFRELLPRVSFALFQTQGDTTTFFILFGPVYLDHEFVFALGIRPRALGCAEQAFSRSLHDDQSRERLGAILYVYRLFLDGVAGGSVHETLRI